MTLDEAIEKYGPIVDGKWDREPEWMQIFLVPGEFYNRLISKYTGGQTTRIYMNKDMHEPFRKALNNLKLAGVDKELKTFDGCFNIRSVRGHPEKLSAHSYGISIDLNASDNPLGGETKFSPDFIHCFEDAGFKWGGWFTRKDPMHFTLAW